MREYEFTVDEALRKGLSPEYHIGVNSPFLSKVLGFRVGRLGLEPFPAGTNPLPEALDLQYSWPFPQFVESKKFNFLVIRDLVNQEDDIYTVSDDNQTLTPVFSIDELTFGAGGTLIDIADFGEYVFMTNGVCMVFWNVGGAWNAFTSSATIPRIGTVCNFKGQLVGGNVKTAWYDCDTRFYIWSRVGSADFTIDQENEAGYRKDPYGGEVIHTRRMEDFVVGYSDKGVTFLFPVTDPAPTFGFKEVSNIGIINKGAENGDLSHRLYVGTDYSLRMITKEGVKELGYIYWIKQLAGEDIIVTYDKFNDDFFIGNSEKTFLLSPFGLSEISQHPSAVWRSDKDHVYLLPSTSDASLPEIISESLDLGYKGQKTVETLESDVTGVTNAKAGIDFSYNITGSFTTGTYKPLNNNGVGVVRTSADLFRFKLKFDTVESGFRVGYLRGRFKMSDLRSIRGVYAPPLRGQS